MYRFTKEKYDKILRFVIGLLAVGVGAFGVYLSAEFFNIETVGYIWVGWLLGFIFVGLELVLLHGAGGGHPVLILFGLVSLYYSVRANITSLTQIAPLAPKDIIISIGIAIEVLPEFLILFALFGDQMPKMFGKSDMGNMFRQPMNGKKYRRNLDDPKIRDIRPTISGIQSIRPTRNVRRFK